MNSMFKSKIIGYGIATFVEILLGGDARQFTKIINHVRLIIISAAVSQFGETFVGLLLMSIKSVLKPDYFKKLFG